MEANIAKQKAKKSNLKKREWEGECVESKERFESSGRGGY